MTTKIASAFSTGTAAEAVEHLKREIACQLSGDSPVLIVVMNSLAHPTEQIVPPLKQAFPDAIVLGCSTAGELTQRGAGDGGSAVFALAGDYKAFSSMATGIKEQAESAVAAAVAELPTAIEGYPYRTGLIFVDSFALSGEETTMLASMLLGEDIPVAGGAAGDDLKMAGVSYVGLNDKVSANALTITMIFSKTPIGMGVCHGHEVWSAPLKVTKANGGVVAEIDGKPAFSVWDELTRENPMRAQLKDITKPGLDGLSGFYGIFELGLANGAEYKIRAPLLALPGGAMGFACGIPEGSEIRIMHSTPDKQIDSAREAARRARAQLGAHPPAGALVIDCACRKLLLLGRLDEAITAMREALGEVPFAGFESYGEIALRAGDFSGFHNTTSVVLAFT
jgi:methyl-accepting chemotaxis protein